MTAALTTNELISVLSYSNIGEKIYYNKIQHYTYNNTQYNNTQYNNTHSTPKYYTYNINPQLSHFFIIISKDIWIK